MCPVFYLLDNDFGIRGGESFSYEVACMLQCRQLIKFLGRGRGGLYPCVIVTVDKT